MNSVKRVRQTTKVIDYGLLCSADDSASSEINDHREQNRNAKQLIPCIGICPTKQGGNAWNRKKQHECYGRERECWQMGCRWFLLTELPGKKHSHRVGEKQTQCAT